MIKKRAFPYLILIIAILFFIVLLMFKNFFYGGNVSMDDVKRLGVQQELIPISNDSTLFTYGGIMIEGEKSNLRARNMEGTILWTIKLKGNVSSIIGCGKDIVVNINNRSIATISKSGEVLWQYELAVPASNILSSDSGLLMIQYKEDAYNSFEIFSMKGVRNCKAAIGSAHVISFDGITGKSYTVSLLDASSSKVVTKIATYNNKGEILWANNFEDMLVSKIKYNNKGDLVAISESSIKKFRSDGKLVKNLDFSNPLLKVSAGNDIIVSIVKNTGFYDVFIHDYNLKQIGSAAVKTKPDGIFAGKNYFLLYDKDNLTLSGRQGKMLAVYESNIDINSTYINNDSDIYIISNRKLQRLTFQK